MHEGVDLVYLSLCRDGLNFELFSQPQAAGLAVVFGLFQIGPTISFRMVLERRARVQPWRIVWGSE